MTCTAVDRTWRHRFTVTRSPSFTLQPRYNMRTLIRINISLTHGYMCMYHITHTWTYMYVCMYVCMNVYALTCSPLRKRNEVRALKAKASNEFSSNINLSLADSLLYYLNMWFQSLSGISCLEPWSLFPCYLSWIIISSWTKIKCDTHHNINKLYTFFCTTSI